MFLIDDKINSIEIQIVSVNKHDDNNFRKDSNLTEDDWQFLHWNLEDLEQWNLLNFCWSTRYWKCLSQISLFLEENETIEKSIIHQLKIVLPSVFVYLDWNWSGETVKLHLNEDKPNEEN